MKQSHWASIVAEERVGQWVAWFDGKPEDAQVGESLWTAAAALLESAGWDRFNIEQAQGAYPDQGSTGARFTVPFRD